MTKKTIEIRRTDGHTDSFHVEAGAYTTILDALEEIRTNQDRTLLYRHSCHHGSCGTCSVLANGARVLACTTRLAELEDTIRLEPLTPFRVIGDLAIDPTELYRDFPREATYLRPSDANPDSAPPEEVPGFQRFENCIECGLCVSACPVTHRFKGPAALAAYNRELEKRPERAEELLAEVGGEDGVFGCDRALRCSQVCPLGVYPAKHIALLKRKVESRKS